MNENFIRDQGYSWKKSRQLLFGSKGIWRNITNGEEAYNKMNLYSCKDGARAIMNERYRNGFEFIENEE